MTLSELQARALAGDVQAQALLGYRYARGMGVRQSYRKAVHWDRLAAEGGEPSAQYNLAQAYFTGRGVRKDEPRALALYATVWSSRAAEDRLRAEAAVNLGWAAKNSRTRRRDLTAARRWYQRAASLGNASAFYNLGLLAAEQGDYNEAARYFGLAAALRHWASMYELARLHVDGLMAHPDPSVATTLLRTAVCKHPRARRLLKSAKLARFQRSSQPWAEPVAPQDQDLGGTWKLRDSDAWLEIEIGRMTRVRCWDPDEDLVVSDVRWDGGELHFVSLCRSTQWRVTNRLLKINKDALLLLRAGAAEEPTTVHRQPAGAGGRAAPRHTRRRTVSG